VLLKLSRFGGAKHASGHDDRSGYCEISLSGSRLFAFGGKADIDLILCNVRFTPKAKTGPGRGIALLSDYLKNKVQQGILAIDDCEVVAAQLIEALLAPLFKPILFNFGKPPTPEWIRYVVGIAVRAFLAAYRINKSTAEDV
jgi:hypothetical protein